MNMNCTLRVQQLQHISLPCNTFLYCATHSKNLRMWPTITTYFSPAQSWNLRMMANATHDKKLKTWPELWSSRSEISSVRSWSFLTSFCRSSQSRNQYDIACALSHTHTNTCLLCKSSNIKHKNFTFSSTDDSLWLSWSETSFVWSWSSAASFCRSSQSCDQYHYARTHTHVYFLRAVT